MYKAFNLIQKLPTRNGHWGEKNEDVASALSLQVARPSWVQIQYTIHCASLVYF